MATILFQAAGAAVGGIFGPLGAIVGRAAGALAGNLVDTALLGGGNTVTGSRLASARIPGASEGTAIVRAYGTTRIGGTLIWATRFEEEVNVERQGGKASGTKVKSYRYFGNIAVGLCEGPVALVRRVYADGQELDLTGVEMRVYPGDAAQLPDPLIEAKQGEGLAPAYRGLAYVVFERLPLDDFGNRIPVLQFEVVRPVGALEAQMRAVTIIPGATEHGYATTRVTERTGDGAARIINRNTLTADTDWTASLDELQALCPGLKRVALVVSWFGTDLRAGQCRIMPGVEVASRNESRDWQVSGLGRGAAHLVSRNGGGPAFGGTPDDQSVVEAIRDLKARGLEVTLYPFLMMDIAADNVLADPYGGAAQAAYPWRGRITGAVAPGRPGTTDGTAAARTDIAAFCGTASTADFTVSGVRVAYHGSEAGYRRMVLHYALLAKAAGGVDGFLIGSELRGLTTLRDEAGRFPCVEHLVTLAEDVRGILGAACGITYGADWSEYFGHQPADGSADIYFHLDPLWACPAITAVGIDNYMPLSDWRDADLAAPNPDGFSSGGDPDGLRRQIAGGEGFDWYYASEADRGARTRMPITDGAAGKPWVYRPKDIEAWWGSLHYERRGGLERSEPTAWRPQMKPVWMTELGCPAVDKGASQPNVFPDPKSAESALPYFSSGARDDAMQRRFLEAHHGHWQAPERPGGMVDAARLFVWAYDARPYPAFPFDRDLFADGNNWRTGHWLNARLGSGTLATIIAAILSDHGITDIDVSAVSGDLTGYSQAQVTSARSLLEPLATAFSLDIFPRGGTTVVRSRHRTSLPATVTDVLADLDGEPLFTETRGHDADHAGEALLTFFDEAGDYREASVRSRRIAAESDRVIATDLSAVLPEETALGAVETMLRDDRMSRHRLELSLGQGDIAVEAGDVLRFGDHLDGRFLVTRIEDGLARALTLSRIATPPRPAAVASTDNAISGGRANEGFAPEIVFLDLPGFEAGEEAGFARVAALSRPFRRIALSSAADGETFNRRVVIDRPATIGRLTAALLPGPVGRFDRFNPVLLQLSYGEMSSAREAAVLNGTNRIAVESATGGFEVIGFAEAVETAKGAWRLTNLLRGLAGTEDRMAAGALPGARAVLLDNAVTPLGLTAEETGMPLAWIAEPLGRTGGLVGPVSVTAGRRASTPLSPVHLRAARGTSGDVAISWVRRGRFDADDWAARDIPLDEPEQRYRLEILAGDEVKRSVETLTPDWTYPAGDEIADFGGRQATLAIRVRQLGRKVPEGIAAKAEIRL